MPLWKIAWRNIEQRGLASSLTALSMALGVSVMIAVIVIYGVAVRQFDQNAQGYHLIVGGKGGALQLVMSTVYHIGQPLYPIPYSYYQKFGYTYLPVPIVVASPSPVPYYQFSRYNYGEFADVTELAIPVCLGDSYESPRGTMFRVIGTTPDMFDAIQYGTYSDGSPKFYEFQDGGRNMKDAAGLTGEDFHQAAFEAVVGSVVAAQAKLKVGDEINPTHGIGAEGHKHEGFKIVGILKPTGTATDRAVFINIEGFYLLEGHALSPEEEAEQSTGDEHSSEAAAGGNHKYDESAEHAHDHTHFHQPLPVDQREVTSILVLCNSPLGPTVLDTVINKGEDRIAQAVAPTREIASLLDRVVGPLRIILLVLTILIVIVAGISILVSMYNSMSERSHDIAVMRALGASRGKVMAIILVESILLALGGGLIGVLLGHGMIGLASPYVVERTGISLSLFEFDWLELVLIPGLIVLASLVGYLPAVAAYRTDVAKALAGSR
jgi:putative ABC transport system permease protein